MDENSTCFIAPNTDLGDLICKTSLIIWDEAPMTNRYCFEALDRTMRDVLKGSNVVPSDVSDLPFGGKVIVFGGDFRQILPVIPKGSREHIVDASLNSSYIWDYCKVLRLTKNMRLQSGALQTEIGHMREYT